MMDFKTLKAGDIIKYSGIIYTARDQAHARIKEIIDKGSATPGVYAKDRSSLVSNLHLEVTPNFPPSCIFKAFSFKLSILFILPFKNTISKCIIGYD